MNNPQSRSDWANLTWQEAQHNVAILLQKFNFMKFEELNLGNSNRVDILVWRKTSSEIIVGVVEVKNYNRITSKTEEKAIIQACRYISNIYKQFNTNSRWKNLQNRYFIAAVFCKDYPTNFSLPNLRKYHKYLPEKLILDNSIEIFSSVPEKLIDNLINHKIIPPKQDKLDNYFY